MKRHACSLVLLIVIACGAIGCSHSLVHRKHESVKTRTAVLIIPGALYSGSAYRSMRDWFTRYDFDVYVPDFESRDGLEGCVANLAAFMEENSLDEYDELHVMTYVLGGWTLNLYLREHSADNITHIVYVRSPIEERMAAVILDDAPRMTAFAKGSTPEEMRDTPYPPSEKGERKIGILIENRAIPYMRRRKKEVLAMGELQWEPESFNQEHDDHMYLRLHHAQMYQNFDLIGPELLHFYRHGKFSDDARRKPYEGDPFGAN